jgi:hypothetical protein
VGTLLILTHAVTGIAVAVPNVPAGESCLHGSTVLGNELCSAGTCLGTATGALSFIVAGLVNRTNCQVEFLTSTLTGLTPTGVLTTIPHIAAPEPIGLVSEVHVFLPPTIHTHQSWHICIGLPL